MTLIVDAAPIIALLSDKEPQHTAVSDILVNEPGALIIPAPVTAEIDYFLGRNLGASARRPFLQDLAAGRFTVPALEQEDYATILALALALDTRYADLRLGLSECSVVVLADRCDTTRILTFDERHFRAVTPIGGGAFTLLPADA